MAVTELANRLEGHSFFRRYIHISSPEVYGSCRGVSEDARLDPSTPYAASRAAGDLSLLTFFKRYGFPLTIVRSTNVYGAHQQLFKIIPRSVIRMKAGGKIQLHGGGRAVKSYIHIRDISKGEEKIMLHGRIGQVYHLSPGKGVSVRDVVNILCGKMGVSFSETIEAVGERPGQDVVYEIDSTLAKKEFGWSPEVSLDDGLAGVVSWIEENWKRIQDEPLEYIHKR
jgi:dTDP-glucose 4,6-dehydratase